MALDLVAVLMGLVVLFAIVHHGLADALELGPQDPQERAAHEMGVVGAGMLSWLTDQVGAAAAGACGVPADLLDFELISRTDLESLLVPLYLAEVPELDPWGGAYEYYLDGPPAMEHLLAIRSPGSDGAFQGTAYAPGPVVDTADDLVWADGYFVRWRPPVTDVEKQASTLADIADVGRAMLDYFADLVSRSMVEGGSYAEFDFSTYDAITASELEGVLVPAYARCLPRLDGWGSFYSFYLDPELLPGEEPLVALRSPGANGVFSGTTYSVGSYVQGEFDEDIVWADGFFVSFPAGAPAVPAAETGGSETTVNTLTAGDQGNPVVVGTGTGSALAFWQGPTVDGLGIFARRLGVDADPQGAELVVEEVHVGDQRHPAASSGGGPVVAVWETPAAGGGIAVVARRFDLTGQPLGPELSIAQLPAGAEPDPAVAVAEDGSYAIAWSAPVGASGSEIRVRAFSAQGLSLGLSQAVSGAGMAVRDHIALAANRDGGYLVAWETDDADGRGVFGRLVGEYGSPVGSEQRLHRHTARDQRRPAVAGDPDGGFAVAWVEEVPPPVGGLKIFGRRFGADLTPLGLTRDEAATTLVEAPALAFDSLGNALLAWRGPVSGSGTTAVLARWLDPRGETLGDDLVLDDSLGIASSAIAVASGPGADFWVLWQDADGSGSGVKARRAGDRITREGFESGDLSGWP